MEREIKFRGKCVSDSRYAGEWVFGGYVHPDKECKNQNEGIIVSYFGGNSTFTCHVIPETVGQFIGLLDKNGKEIYEGDIIRLLGVGVFYVAYNEERCQFELHDSDGFADKLWELNSDRYEVIGNIFDDPKLLKNYDRQRKNKSRG